MKALLTRIIKMLKEEFIECPKLSHSLNITEAIKEGWLG